MKKDMIDQPSLEPMHRRIAFARVCFYCGWNTMCLQLCVTATRTTRTCALQSAFMFDVALFFLIPLDTTLASQSCKNGVVVSVLVFSNVFFFKQNF